MPELPEVETIRRDLNSKITGKKITGIFVLDKRTVKSSLSNFKKTLVGAKIVRVERRGKLLIFQLSSPRRRGSSGSSNFLDSRLRGNDRWHELYLLVHLKMTGQLIYLVESRKGKVKIVAGGHSEPTKPNFDLPNKQTRVVIEFADKSKLFFNDLRVFGYMKIVNEKEKEKIVDDGFGIEPLDKKFTLGFLENLLAGKKTNLKAFLLNQKFIAGIGNIYADEICFRAGVRPTRKVDSIKPDEVKKIFASIPAILKLAVKHRGTTFNNYVDSDGRKGNFVRFLKVYGRAGQKCLKCGGIITKTRHAGRGTHYCPSCQS